MTDIEIKTRSIYDSLSPAEQKVARYFLQNLGSVFDDPISVLAEKSGVADSTLRLTVSPTYGRVKNTGIVTIQKLCQGMGITLEQFFDSPLFKDIDPEP